ncbi:hypothetical protein LWI28_019395 [Acer negundo]|uniref:Uncharacterized protein n=1 Tax=Acer negundo TaxID=4023 RepID=A0AAD5J6W5_ACENE|nr:hypothetical protein LWI28_019395 [Acer negundo]
MARDQATSSQHRFGGNNIIYHLNQAGLTVFQPRLFMAQDQGNNVKPPVQLQQHHGTSQSSRFDGHLTMAVHGSKSGNIKPPPVRQQQHHGTSKLSLFDGLSTRAVHGSMSYSSSLQDNLPFVSAVTAVRLYPLAVVPPSTHHGVRRQSLPVAIHFSYNRGSVMSSCLTTIKYRAAKADKKAF